MKPPSLPLKFGVNSIARSSSLSKAFHLSQNSTVIAAAPDRFTARLRKSLDAVEARRLVGIAGDGAGDAEVVPPVAVAWFGRLAVGERRPGGLAHAPVAEQAGGVEHGVAVVRDARGR